MAIPLIGAAVPGLMTALKGLGGKAAIKGGLRMAGSALKGGGKFLLNNAGSNTTDRLMRVGPDVFFGGVAALNNPGDLGDKLIAGTTQALGGAVGGIGAGGLARKLNAPAGAQFIADMGGSFGGDYAGMYLGDALQRLKGDGMTPYERLAADGDIQRQREIEERLMQAYGLAGHRPLDPFFAENGLA